MKLPREAVAFFRSRFTEEGRPERAQFEKSYLKSSLSFHGVDAPALRRAAADFRRAHPELSRGDAREIVEALYETEWFDLHSAAIGILEQKPPLLEPRDLPFLIDL